MKTELYIFLFLCACPIIYYGISLLGYLLTLIISCILIIWYLTIFPFRFILILKFKKLNKTYPKYVEYEINKFKRRSSRGITTRFNYYFGYELLFATISYLFCSLYRINLSNPDAPSTGSNPILTNIEVIRVLNRHSSTELKNIENKIIEKEKYRKLDAKYYYGIAEYKKSNPNATEKEILENEYLIQILHNKKIKEEELIRENEALKRKKALENIKLDIKTYEQILFSTDELHIYNWLEKNNVECFYHFTDIKNISSIKRIGGLCSWYLLEKNNISYISGGSNLSKELDSYYGLENYVRLSFCKKHPMSHHLENHSKIVVLKVKTFVAYFDSTLFSNINATKTNHQCGKGIKYLDKVNYYATQQEYVKSNSIFFDENQAEILVNGFIPIKYILNIDEFL